MVTMSGRYQEEHVIEMESEKYSASEMQIRQECIMKLQSYLNEHMKQVYEFSHDWVAKGNTDTTGLEEDFLVYVNNIEKESNTH